MKIYICKYPAWALNRMKIKTQDPAHNNNRREEVPTTLETTPRTNMVVPYSKGLSEILRKQAVNMGYKCILKEA